MKKKPHPKSEVNKHSLKKITSDIEKFTKLKLDAAKTDNAYIGTTPQLNFEGRKEKRKAARLLKKAKKFAFHSHRTLKEVISERKEFKKLKTTGNKDKEEKKLTKQEDLVVKQVKLESDDSGDEDLETLKAECQENRKKQLLKANEEEDITIRKLEKKLKLKSRKTKTVSQSFVNDGLDFILEACVPGLYESLVLKEEATESENKIGKLKNTEENKGLAIIKNRGKLKIEDDDGEMDSESDSIENDELRDEDECDDSPDDIEQDNSCSDEHSARTDGSDVDDDFSENNVSDASYKLKSSRKIKNKDKIQNDKPVAVSSSSKKKKLKTNEKQLDENQPPSKKLKEDIYGRLRDKHGNIVQEKYVSPALRSISGDEKSMQDVRVKKQMKGLLNRVSESNMVSISNQIEELYMSNSRHIVNETLTTLLFESCVQSMNMPDRLMMEHVMLVALLHNNVGSEVGAHFLHVLVKKFDELYHLGENYGLGKQCDNIILLLCHLYSFKVTHCVLMFDIIRRLSDSFTEKDIELLLLMFKSIGFPLRKDDPVALKEIILKVQSKASSIVGKVSESRIKFMLDVILAIRNNNMRKIPNYDPSQMEHLLKVFRNFIKGKGSSESELHISLNDLLHSDDRGRWWVVGSAWTGRETDNQEPDLKKPELNEVKFTNTKIVDLARKQRMNTDTRKKIFYILMTAADYIDAFEKLLKIGLKGDQQQEIIHIIMNCCQQEKDYNHFYALLAQKFCQYDRVFQLTIQFSLWDKLKNAKSLTDVQWSHLAKFLTHLFLTQALSLSILKVIQFSELDKFIVQFLQELLINLLTYKDEGTSCKVFLRIAQFPKLHILREGLRLFMHHFILRTKNKLPENIQKIIKEKVALAETALTCSQSKSLL